MKLTQKLKAEILKAYNGYWDAYLSGDMKTFASFLDDNCHIIGSTAHDTFNNKKVAVAFYKATAQQVAGIGEYRNRKITILPQKENIMVQEICDYYFLEKKKWHFYGVARISTLFGKKYGKWKIIHQHGSLPDSRAEEGQQFGIEKIRKENQQLKEAVNRSTIELRNKNRELETDASLEKVRAVAMGMKKREDMLKICKTIAQQLKKLGVEEIRNVQTAIFYPEKGTYMNYEYYAKHNKTFITEVNYTNHKIHKAFAIRMLKGKGEFYITNIKGRQKLDDWIAYQKTTNVFIDKYLTKASSLNYYWFSLGPVALGISTYHALNEEEKKLFKRFVTVFDLAYRRYLDIEKAEAQAKEARVQTALERVRAVAMAMHKPEDLSVIGKTIFNELKALGFTGIRNTEMVINNDEKETVKSYHYSEYGKEEIIEIGYKENLIVKKWAEDLRKTEDAFVPVTIFQKQLKAWDKYRNQLGYKTDPTFAKAKAVYYYSYSIGLGALSISTWNVLTNGQLKLLERFRNVFQLSYRRYMDIARAEMQAREAQIEAALEKVRSRSMAMHKSDELKEVIRVVLEQFIHLKVNVEHAGFYIDYKANDDMHIWLADPNIEPFYAIIPYFDTPTWNSFLEAKTKGIVFHTDLLDFEEKNKFYRSLFKLFTIPEEARGFYLQCKGLAVSTVLLDNVGLYIENFSAVPYTDEENSILMRFGKVFQQTYTRFLDLQKAEAQAKEAQIEAALERVRARTMAMHNSNEMAEVAALLFDQIKLLGIATYSSGFNIWDKEQMNLISWMSNPVGGINPPFEMPIHTYNQHEHLYQLWKNNKLFEEDDLIGDRLVRHYNFLRSFPLLDAAFTRSEQSGIKTPERQVHNNAFFSNGYLLFITLQPCPEAHDIFKRFAKVFDQTYTRFLDLKKAEAQARESEIQLALERVRAKSLAMHHTSELQDVVDILAQQLLGMGIDINGGVLITINDEVGENISLWASSGAADYVQKVEVPFFDKPIFTHLRDAIKRRNNFFEETYSKVEKNEMFHHLFRFEPWSSSPEERKKELLSREGGLTRAATISQHTSIAITNHNGKKFLEEEKEILTRFGKVFEQTYTRFLDLQKAEAQAREAQIEASMERVRARSMAMQKSSEVNDVISVLFRQFDILGMNPAFAHLSLYKEDGKTGIVRMTDKSGDRVMAEAEVDLDAYPEWRESYEQWKVTEENFVHIIDYPAGVVPYILSLLKDVLDKMPEEHRFKPDDFPHGFVTVQSHCRFGYMGVEIERKPTEEEKSIVARFAREFGRIYQRVLDLEKSEAQAREAQIEAALERIRSRSLAMHHSSELSSVVDTLLQEFTKLDFTLTFCIINLINEEDQSNTVWAANPETGKDAESYYMKFEDYPFHHAMWNAWKEQKKNFIYTIEGEEKKIYDEYLFTKTEFRRFPKHVQEANKALKRYVVGFTFFKYSGLQTVSENYISEEDLAILERFGRVFEQSYTRFLDLKKAEAQAREAQIEAALERVRSRSMAMRTSDELQDVLSLLFQQYDVLGIHPVNVFLTLFEFDQDRFIYRASGKGGARAIGQQSVNFSASPIWKEVIEKFRNEKSGTTELIHYPKESLPGIFEIFHEAFTAVPEEYQIRPEDFPDGIYTTHGHNEFGYLGVNHTRPCTKEESEIIARFAKEFGRVYQRFLDLQKAEAQAREAQIEASLERIRSRTMAMHKSEELLEVIMAVSEQLEHLQFRFHNVSFVINNRDYDLDYWLASPGQSHPFRIHVPYLDNPVITRFRDARNKGISFYADVLTREENLHWIKHMLENSVLKNIPDNDRQYLMSRQGFARSVVLTNHITLVIGNYASAPYSDEQNAILKRFANVFEQSYTRFLDLQKAEAQAREATIEAALERTRTQSMIMQHSNELDDTLRVFHQQVLLLGIPSAFSFLWLPDEDKDRHIFWAAWAENNSNYCRSKAINYPLDRNEPATAQCLIDWKGKQPVVSYHVPPAGIESYFAAWSELIAGVEHLKSEYFSQGVHYVEAFMKYGCFGVMVKSELTEEEKKILYRFAIEFERTYTRFLDLQKAEAQAELARRNLIQIQEEKQRAETALSELQTTQKQLIQAEKMASLGELTAGIAHEIQNPLNFVNNFSEVSKELLDEMREAIEKGDAEEAKEIMNDVIQNLEKINHHGKRADGIVKGMLQHSRSSSGIKEPTDINALADEYLRLAYHGLRAKDKSFNATMKTDFDELLEKINVIPQDIGRVILNLITNAFYVVNKKSKQGIAGYEPTVSVSTKKDNGQVEISVKDNGGGIPQKVMDKIFQPFFTTKPAGQGTGLGLSLSYDIVKAHGGAIIVETKDGEGSEFIIQLPVV